MVSAATQPESELFCTTTKTHAKVERHPSTLVPGGHASPLRHPTVLRPGAGQLHHHPHARKSSENIGSQTPRPTSQQAPKPIYRAYSPANAPQSPTASVVAHEIEGYFTALGVPPLNIQKETEPSHSVHTPSPGRESPVQRCSSPPVPPKVKLEEAAQPYQHIESSRPTPPEATEIQREDGPSEPEAPPAYDESDRVTPPPEKVQTAPQSVSRDDNLPAATAASASRLGGSVAGNDTEEALVPQVTEAAAIDGEASHDDEPTNETENTIISRKSVPPPLPPRAASVSPEIQPDCMTHMPGSFPPPPKRSPSPKGSSPQDGAAGAAASSATAVGAAVAMPSSDFAHNGLRHARNAMSKHMKHMVDKAKEHHEQHQAKRSSASRSGFEDGKTRNVLVVAPIG